MRTRKIIDAAFKLAAAAYELNRNEGVRLSYALTHEVRPLLWLSLMAWCLGP